MRFAVSFMLAALAAGCAHDDEARRDELVALRREMRDLRRAQKEAQRVQEGMRGALFDLARTMKPPEVGDEAAGSAGDTPELREEGPRFPQAPIFAGRVIQPYPESWEFYLGEPPEGWGRNALSAVWTNDVTGCFMEVTFAGKPARVLTREGLPADGTVWTVKEGSRLRPASLIPPGETVYFLRDHPGLQNWTARCYSGPPRLVRMEMTSGGPQVFSALQFTSEARGELLGGTKRRHIRLSVVHMRPMEAVF